ncbi:AAA family ATPase [Microlunatus flavus]|uniref:MoxR-like ATPase n=1 Tax=Microlunatus flavus TaxID=1036181 RepID=A0A1H9M2L5_9ACTN|nr:MoxR family ATPase [Microlunatus flavus]SER17707.1 MoxR-like ATPase [Microlunatus flavus]
MTQAPDPHAWSRASVEQQRQQQEEARPPAAGSANPLEQVLFEVKRTIVGQDVLLERMAVAMLAGGHLLVEGVPGLAKTLAVKSLAGAIGGAFQRIQFTPDLVPADLVGTRVYHQRTGEFETTLGPVFANLLLADEINRAPAKVQSALLEVMQERQVTIGRETHRVPEPFLVMATQNPIESDGTYPLPEAQVDRFMMKVLVGYPSSPEEHAIVERALQPAPAPQVMLQPADLVAMREQVERVYVDPAIVDYAVRLVAATRSPASVGQGDLERYVTYGASPRASIALVLGARALAFLRGRDYVLPHDVDEIGLDVLRHRVVLSYEALADGLDADTVLVRVLRAVAAPDVVLQG